MYARVASFEDRDPSLTDELIERVRERGPGAVPDARGFLGLFDRERPRSLIDCGFLRALELSSRTKRHG